MTIDTVRLVAELRFVTGDIDTERDQLDPLGGNFAPHRAGGGLVNLNHLRRLPDGSWQHGSDKKGTAATVAKCIDPDTGRYSVQLRPVRPGSRFLEPVAVVYFDANDELSLATFKAVEAGDIRGVSVEAIGRKWVTDRFSRRFTEWDLTGIALTRTPTNRAARVLKCWREPLARTTRSCVELDSFFSRR